VKRIIGLGTASLTLLACVHWSPAQDPRKLDLNFQQSPARPAPEWLNLVDQGQFDPRLKGYLAPAGFKVEIAAEEPVVINPVGMTFGPDGTLYVLEWVPPADPTSNFPESSITFTYKDGSKRKVAIMRKPLKDWVKVLTDSKGKGVYDHARVILHDELPSSILIHDDGLYLSGQGTVRRYPLAQVLKESQNGQRDFTPAIIAQGFCGFHHHQVSGLTIGNDGWLYVTSGDDDNLVEGSDGSRATVLRTGAIFRCRPDGSKMHTYALGFRNPYRDVVFDTAFNMFHADNDNEDGSKFTGCRLMHIPEGADFGWRLRVGARCCVPDPARAAVYGELPGKLAPMLKTGRGAPAGLLIYNDTFLPPEHRGWLLYPDVFRKLIRAYKVEPKGATFEVTQEFEFLKASDPLFRPCQMVLGPDGAIYVCDWRTDSGGAGRLWGDGKHGRIYRITWAGTAEQPAIPTRGLDTWAKILQQGDAELLRTLESENFSDRQQAQRELVRRGDKHRPALLAVLNDAKKPLPARLAALGALQSFWNEDVQATFVSMLKDSHPDVRRLCADALALNGKRGDRNIHEALVQVLNDEDPAVLRALYLAVGKIAAPGAADTVANGLQFDDSKDAYLHDGMVRALEQVGKEGFQRLQAWSDSGEGKDLDRVVNIFPAFRSREAAQALGPLLKNYHLTVAQRIDLIRSYNHFQLDPPVSLRPLADYLAQLDADPPKEIKPDQLAAVKLAAIEVLSTNGAMNTDKARSLFAAMLGQKSPQLRLAVIQAIDTGRVTQAAPLLVEMLGKSDSTAERIALARALGSFGTQTVDSWKVLETLLKDREAGLRLEALRALAALDYRKARKSAEALLADADLQVQQEAVVLLGRDPDGARLVGQRFVQNQLPRALLPLVAEGLRRYAKDRPGHARLLAEVMKGGLLISTSPTDVERIAELVRTKGDPRNGRALYLNNQALACINCHRLEGVGGNVGPDLTRVWETHSLAKVMEAILDPSKEIKEGYQTYVAVTKSGQVVTGLRVSQNDKEAVLRDATGKQVRIAAKELDELTPSKKSLMPDDVVTHLKFDEFIDLVAFLRDRQAQESLRGLALEFLVVGPLPGDSAAAIEKGPDPAKAVEAGGKKFSWQPRRADPSGYLNLKGLLRAKDAVYALTYVFSPKEQRVKMGIGSPEARVWINGEKLHDERTLELDEIQREVVLPGGWSTVLVRAGAADGNLPGFGLRFIGGEGLRLSPRREADIPALK
jgi:putative membrane-bound dehydrogenase-like protein